MRPIPVAFHIWFLEVHTYGIGLALTFWFGLRYTERRLRQRRLSLAVGDRHVRVGDRGRHRRRPGPARPVQPLVLLAPPGQVFAIWQGGLSSFGGLLFAVPVAIVSARRRCPQLPTMRFADLMAPVLMACWGIGRLLGPQLMVAGGGHPTKQWFGMYYAGQVGKRLPVPIFQAIEDFTIFGILLLVERWLRTTAPAPVVRRRGRTAAAALPPAGIVLGVGMVLWGIERFLDEHLWLGEDGHLGSLLVQWAGIALAVAGLGPADLADRTPATVAPRARAAIRPRSPSPTPGPTPSGPRETRDDLVRHRCRLGRRRARIGAGRAGLQLRTATDRSVPPEDVAPGCGLRPAGDRPG